MTIAEALSLASQLQRTGRLAEAEKLCDQIVKADPAPHAALNILGKIAIQRGQNQSARELFERAVALEPRIGEYPGNLGLALLGLGRLEESVAASRSALAINPKLTPPYNNLALALNRQGKPDEAIAAYRKAIAIRPDYLIAINNLGDLLGSLGEVEEAVALFRRAISLRPDYPPARSNLLLYLNYLSDVTPQSIFQEHRKWHADFATPLRTGAAAYKNDPLPHRRLRVGYVSPDFHDTSVSRFLLPLMDHHDRADFEIICLSDVVAEDEITRRFRKCSHDWHSLLGLKPEEIDALIRRLQIDILVDLTGHTASNRLMVFARKPAPIQVSYLGYPCTTGLSTIDYRLTDSIADPPGFSDKICSEELMRLPRTNWCFEPPEAAKTAQAFKERPEGPLRFGSFNNFAKASRAALRMWMQVLRQNPHAELWVKASALNARAARNKLTDALKSASIDEARLKIIPFQADLVRHFELYNEIDVALDTFPYHGTTTTCDALWMGTPVVTLAGEAHVSRVGASLLSSIGLSEFVASSEAEFVGIATKLAGDQTLRADLRNTLRKRMAKSPLMDGKSLARDVESAYRAMWGSWCQAVN